jgi:hypothetical protein
MTGAVVPMPATARSREWASRYFDNTIPHRRMKRLASWHESPLKVALPILGRDGSPDYC